MSFFSSKKYLSLWVFITALLIRVSSLALFRYEFPLKWMIDAHDQRALALISGKQVMYANAWSTFYILLGGFYKIIDWLGLIEQRMFVMLVVQVLMGSCAAVLVFLIAERFLGKLKGVLSGFLFALYFPFAYINFQVISETFSVLLILGCFYLLLFNKKTAAYLMIGVMLALAVAIRPMLMTFVPFAIAWIFIETWKKTRIKLLVIFVVGFMLIYCLFAGINMMVSHDHQFETSGSGGANIAMANCELKRLEYRTDDGNSFYFKPPAYFDTSGEEVMTTVPFADDGFYIQMAIDCIRKNPQQLLNNFTHIYRVYDSEFYPNFSSNRWHLQLIELWKFVAVILTGLFFITPLFINKPLSRFYTLSLGYLLSLFFAVYIANPGEERYLIPYFFVIVVFGVSTLVDLLRMVYKTMFKLTKTTPTKV